MVGRLLSLLVLSTATLWLGGTVALADDGPPRLLSVAGRLRPPETIERAVNFGNRKVLLAINGYGSTPAEAGYWDPLFRRLPEFDHQIFGVDRCVYDTIGPLRQNGAELRACVRHLSRDEDYDEVRIGGVSMGGATTLEALRQGLSATDGLGAVVMFGAPANGSSTAALVGGALSVAERFDARRDTASLARLILRTEIDTPAMRDLARPVTPLIPAGVPVLAFMSTGDEFVSRADGELPGRTKHTLTLPFVSNGSPAHGGQMAEPHRVDEAAAFLRGQTPRADPIEEAAAAVLTPPVDMIRTLLLLGVATVFVTAGIVVSSARRARRCLPWRSL